MAAYSEGSMITTMHPRTHGILLASTTVLLAAVLSAGGVVRAQDGGISVAATGVAYGPPDLAYLDVGFTTTDADVASALRAAEDAIAAVQQALAEMGVEDRDVRTTTFSVWREERYDDRGTAAPTVVYRVTHHLRVTVREVDAVGRLLVASTEAGANYVGGVVFTVQDARELAASARRSAFSAARAKAEQLAELAGVALGSPTSIVEVEVGGPVVPFATARAAPMALEADAAVTSGELAVEVRLEIVFEVR
jgi:uncharacterized protein